MPKESKEDGLKQAQEINFVKCCATLEQGMENIIHYRYTHNKTYRKEQIYIIME